MFPIPRDVMLNEVKHLLFPGITTQEKETTADSSAVPQNDIL
jgi:hypothetical protein